MPTSHDLRQDAEIDKMRSQVLKLQRRIAALEKKIKALLSGQKSPPGGGRLARQSKKK